jgi:hypothetical protein
MASLWVRGNEAFYEAEKKLSEIDSLALSAAEGNKQFAAAALHWPAWIFGIISRRWP